VIRLAACAIAAALAAAVLAPRPAAASDAVAEAEREAARLEARLGELEAQAARPDESAAAVAVRKFSDGETQYLLGDWTHAAVLLAGAVDDPTFRAGSSYGDALFYLADSLRRQGACASARPVYDALLARAGGEHRGEALAGALACAAERQQAGDVDRLLADADRTFAGDAPAEVRYLAAKTIFQRTDLEPTVRRERARAAFAAVPPPYLQQASYFLGVLDLEVNDLAAAQARFEACHAAAAQDARQREVQDLCALALGRVQGELGHGAEALDWYARVPRDSPHFTDAAYETAWSFVKAGHDDVALRTAAMISDLAPESPLAPEATVLQGHLLLRLGRYAEATEAYSRVINQYAPVRDEIDAILATRNDPVRWSDELVVGQVKGFEVASLLPAVALRWASTRRDVAGALGLVHELGEGRKDVDDANGLAERIDALLSRGNGVDAFPHLRATYAGAQAVVNGAARLAGAAGDAALAAATRALSADDRARLDAIHARRAALGIKIAALPRTPEEVAARAERMHARVDRLERDAFRLGYEIQAVNAAIGGAEVWAERHRAEIDANPEDRAEFNDELRTHRAVAAGYEEELRRLHQDIALARDAAGGTEALAEEARLRAAWVALLGEEREVLGAARATLTPAAAATLDRAASLAERAERVRVRADRVGEVVTAAATRRAGELRERIAREQAEVAAEVRALDGIQAEARQVVGRIAFRAFQDVRTQFYGIVLKADVGLVDVAWSRKRARLDKIQQLSAQKATELEQLDRDYRDLLREVE
jgi:tetratricopeptide (TPR) repeat protein